MIFITTFFFFFYRFEVNANEEETYQCWTKLLDDVNGYLREHFSINGFKALKEKEIAWIRKKEVAMKDAETSSLKYKTVAICMGKESLLADRDDSVLGKESINGGWSV